MIKLKIILLFFFILIFLINSQDHNISDSIIKNRIGFLIGSENAMTFISYLGGGWARPHPGPFAWDYIESEKGRFDFNFTDRFVKSAQENNIAILGTIWPFAEWDQKTCHGKEVMITEKDVFYPKHRFRGIPVSRGMPCNIEDYKNFLTKLIERYDGDGIDDMPGLKMPVRYWEVLNEPEMQEEFLTFFKGTYEDYVEILKISYKTIKSACKECLVVQGGAAGSQKTKIFWDKVLDLGGGDYFDIANVHFINHGDLKTLNVKEFKKLLDKKGVQKSIWVTEAQFKKESDILSAVDGAIKAGAEKIFFTQFKVGQFGMPKSGDYSKVYNKVIKKYK